MARLGLIQRALRQAYREARAAGVPDEITHGYLRFGREGMTPAAKAARAAEQRYGQTLYRGITPRRGFELSDGLTHRFASRHRVRDEPIAFAAEDPAFANRFAHEEGGVVFPVVSRSDIFDPRLGSDMNRLADSAWDIAANEAGGSERVADQYVQGLRRTLNDAARERDHNWDMIENYSPDFRDAGFGGFRMREDGHTTYGFMNQSELRSPNATFDPRRRHWNNLLAATTAGAPIGLLALLARRNDEVA